MIHRLQKKNGRAWERMTTATPWEWAAPWAATIVRAVHILFIAWMVWAPWSGSRDVLVIHAVACPFLMMHWLTSTDGCVLTLMEKHLRGLERDDQSFIHSLVAPVYVIDDAQLRTLVTLGTAGLWAVTLTKLGMLR